jgi:hypothetical protein
MEDLVRHLVNTLIVIAARKGMSLKQYRDSATKVTD